MTQIILQMWSHDQRLLILPLPWEKFQKNQFFWGVLWLKFNNLGLGLDMALKFYTSVAKGLKLKFRNFWVLILTFLEVTKKKLVGGPSYPPILNRVNIDTYSFTGPKQSSWLGLNFNTHVKVVRNVNFKTYTHSFW